jgi:hypothetical protein
MVSQPVEALAKRQVELRAALSQTTDMRPGSLVERYRVCGKPSSDLVQPGRFQ